MEAEPKIARKRPGASKGWSKHKKKELLSVLMMWLVEGLICQALWSFKI
jgi:hypothetical protein